MSYQLPEVRANAEAEALTNEQHSGRPKKYDEPTKGITFRVRESMKIEGSVKRAKYRFNLTKLLAIHYMDFLRRPIEESQAFIDTWEIEHGPVEDFNEFLP